MEIKNIIGKIITTESKRKVFLTIFSEMIKYANTFGPEKWGVRVANDSIRISIGNLITATLQNDSIWMSLDKEFLTQNTPRLDNLLEKDWDKGEWAEYKAIKTKNYYYKDNSLEKWQDIKHLHLEVIKKTCEKYHQLRFDIQKYHSPDFIDYLQKECNTKIPQPQYEEQKRNEYIKFTNTGYWIFFCNPKLWQIEEFLEAEEINLTWKITNWQKDYFRKGQYGVIRVGKDERNKKQLNGRSHLESGIYGIVEITSEAELIPDSDEEYEEERLRVNLRFIKKLLDNPILLSDLKNLNDFQSEAVLLNGWRGSSWSLSEEAFDKLTNLAESNIIKLNEQVNEIASEKLFDISDLQKLELKYSNATPRVKEIVSQRIERGNIAKEIKKANNFECQICKALKQNPYGFKKSNGEYYVETHHIIPVSELEQGSLGTLNLLTVCANHHRQLHYGNVEMIENNDKIFVFKIEKIRVEIEKIKVSQTTCC